MKLMCVCVGRAGLTGDHPQGPIGPTAAPRPVAGLGPGPEAVRASLPAPEGLGPGHPKGTDSARAPVVGRRGGGGGVAGAHGRRPLAGPQAPLSSAGWAR